MKDRRGMEKLSNIRRLNGKLVQLEIIEKDGWVDIRGHFTKDEGFKSKYLNLRSIGYVDDVVGN